MVIVIVSIYSYNYILYSCLRPIILHLTLSICLYIGITYNMMERDDVVEQLPPALYTIQVYMCVCVWGVYLCMCVGGVCVYVFMYVCIPVLYTHTIYYKYIHTYFTHPHVHTLRTHALYTYIHTIYTYI